MFAIISLVCILIVATATAIIVGSAILYMMKVDDMIRNETEKF